MERRETRCEDDAYLHLNQEVARMPDTSARDGVVTVHFSQLRESLYPGNRGRAYASTPLNFFLGAAREARRFLERSQNYHMSLFFSSAAQTKATSEQAALGSSCIVVLATPPLPSRHLVPCSVQDGRAQPPLHNQKKLTCGIMVIRTCKATGLRWPCPLLRICTSEDCNPARASSTRDTVGNRT